MTRAQLRMLGGWIAFLIPFGAQPAGPTLQVRQNLCIRQPTACVANAALPQNRSTIKWHPGHYMSLRNNHKYDSEDQGYITQIGNEPTITGILRDWNWRDLETSKGVYDFSGIDTYLNTVKSLPTRKRMIIRIENRVFGKQTGTTVPDYLKTDPAYQGGEVPMGNGVVARIWDRPVMDRLIALYQALAVRYDSDPYVEGISTSETSIGFSTDYPAPATYSPDALLTQLERFVAATRAAWPHSNVFVETNYLGSNSQMESFIKYCMVNQSTVGGPDTWNRAYVTTGKRALQSDAVVTGTKGSGTDYRGIIAIKSEVEATELGGYIATFTPAEVYDVAFNIMHANFIVWDRNDYYGGPEQQWTTGILPFIRSVGGKTYTNCPSSFTSSCEAN
jgi:hypothetical protein